MHPFLTQWRKLAIYLLAWIPTAILLAYLMSVSGRVAVAEGLLLAAPLCLIYAFVCLSAWYICRVTPIEKSGMAKIIFTNFAAALIAAELWVWTAKGAALKLSGYTRFAGLDKRFAPEIPLLFGTGILLYELCGAFYYLIIALQASRDAESRAMRANVLAREAELKALKAQVNPHFLFNSLNSISALTTSDAAKAREMCILLGDFLRRTLGLGEKPVIPLEEELSLIHAFLAVEKIRFGARLRTEENIDPSALAFDIPPLLLQPLVENAVGHGVANLVEGGSIRLIVQSQDGSLSIAVENNFDPEAPPRRRSGVGLANVRQRLESRYGTRSSFRAGAEGALFRVTLSFPAEREAGGS